MINRRRFLKYSAGALAMPLLASSRASWADERNGFPKRFLVVYQPNGTKKELWSPGADATETSFELGPLLTPLNGFKDRLVLFDGINMDIAGMGPGGPHQRGMASLLTGEPITEGDFVGGDGRRAGWGGGPSIDQVMVNALRPSTALSSLELGVRVKEAIPRSRIIYRGAEQPVAPINDPVEAYERAFGGAIQQSGSSEDMAALLKTRRSILDFVYGDFQRQQAKVSREDAMKLENHAESLRDLERRMSVIVERDDNCLPDAPSPMDVMGEAEFRALLRAQVDVMVNAFACDVTRIGSIQCSSAVNALRFTFMGLNDNEGHSLSHSGDSNELLQGQWDQMLTWYSEQQAYLLERLASVSEGAGTLLDNTLLLFVNEISRGNTHSHEDMPFILAGGAGGALNAGRYLRYDNENHLRLLQSVLELMDVDSSDFGLREFRSLGPLPGIL